MSENALNPIDWDKLFNLLISIFWKKDKYSGFCLFKLEISLKFISLLFKNLIFLLEKMSFIFELSEFWTNGIFTDEGSSFFLKLYYHHYLYYNH